MFTKKKWGISVCLVLIMIFSYGNSTFGANAPKVATIAAGGAHTLALQSDGTVCSFGANTYGQLGDGTTNPRTTKVAVTGLTGVISVAAGENHSLALKSDGTVWAWGDNLDGQLGTRTTDNQMNPVLVSGLTGVVAIAAGAGHSVALKNDGTVWAWGRNGDGQLGIGGANNQLAPVQVTGLSGITKLACGQNHTIAVKSDGTVWTWGKNDHGQLGNGPTGNQSTPVQVTGLSGIIAVTGGAGHTLALQSDGTVWAWGDNDSGQLGDGTTNPKIVPMMIPGLSEVIQIYAAETASFALKSDGTVWAWGGNQNGQLGDGSYFNRYTPAPVAGIAKVKEIAGAYQHIIVHQSNGEIWAWGLNSNGQLGDGSINGKNIPSQVKGLTGTIPGIIAIAGYGNHSLALKDNGMVWSWGRNDYGQLGDGTVSAGKNLPVPVRGLTDITAVACGEVHSMALKADGTVWTWGQNQYGQLGDYSSVPRNAPTQVLNLANVIQISCGSNHNLALKSDGTVWAWGANISGAVGDGTKINKYAPVQVGGLTHIIAIAGGPGFSIALKDDGTVWAWGSNWTGQLGDGTFNDKGSPVQVVGLTDVIAIAAGGLHSLALKSDGTVWAWGYNYDGQLGDGTGVSQNIPVCVSGLNEITAISGGSVNSIALKSDGTVWTWGSNSDGQIGDGSMYGGQLTPVQVSGIADAMAIVSGSYRAMVLKSDGSVLAWGGNNFGQLGDGTFDQRNTPVQVQGLTSLDTPSEPPVLESIFGMVLKPDGAPYTPGYSPDGSYMDGAVQLRTNDGQDIISQYYINPDGTYRLEGPVAPGDYLLSVYLWGYNNPYFDSIPMMVHMVTGQSQRQDLMVSNPTISGNILKPDGSIFNREPDSYVDVILRSSNGNEIWANVTDDGAYRLGGNIPSGDYTLITNVSGSSNPYTSSTPIVIHVVAGQTISQDIRLTNPSITGKVLTPDGIPFIPDYNMDANVYLRTIGPNGQDVAISGISSDGSFKLGGDLPSGDYQLGANALGNNPYFNAVPITIHFIAGESLAQDISLTSPIIMGNVLRPDGSIINRNEDPNTFVDIILQNLNGSYFWTYMRDDGSYRLGGEIPPGDYQLDAHPGGSGNPYTDSSPIMIHIDAGQTITQDIQLTNPTIIGNVLNPDGFPLIREPNMDVRVYLRTIGPNSQEVAGSNIADDGSFRLGANIPTGDYQLGAYSWGSNNPYTDATPITIHYIAGELLTQDIRLTSPAIIGNVLKPDGTLLIRESNMNVWVHLKTTGPNQQDVAQAAINNEGSFKLCGDIPSGDYLLIATSWGSNNPYTESIPMVIHYIAGQLVTQDIRLTNPLISGRVLKPDGSCFSRELDSWVDIFLRNSKGNNFGFGIQDDGTYRVGPNIPVGTYQITAYARGSNNPYAASLPVTIQISEGNQVSQDFVLTHQMITGKVLKPDGTIYIPGWVVNNYEIGATVHLTTSNGQDVTEAPTIESDGSYRFGEGIPTGDYLLTVYTWGNDNPYTNSIPIPIHYIAGQFITQDIRLTYPTVVGKVLKPDGTPFTPGNEMNGNVYLVRTDSNQHDAINSQIGGDGSFRLGANIPTGDYRLCVNVWGSNNSYSSGIPIPLHIIAGQSVTQDIRLINTLITGRILTPDGTPFISAPDSWVTIFISDLAGRQVAGFGTNNNESYRWGGDIPDGEYKIVAWGRGSNNPYAASLPVRVQVAQGSLTTQDLTLTDPVVKGRVLKPDGTPFIPGWELDGSEMYGFVHLKSINGQDVTEPSEIENGIYRLGGDVPTGDYQLTTELLGKDNPYFPPVPITIHVNQGQLLIQDIQLRASNSPPLVETIGNKTVSAGQLLQFKVMATDPDGDQLTYSGSNLPEGAVFDVTTHEFSWTPGNTQVGTYLLHFSASDGFLTTSQDVTITVNVPGNLVKVKLLSSIGTGVAGGHVTYAGSSWQSMGDTDADGTVSLVLPTTMNSITVRMTYGGISQDLTQNIRDNSTFTFRTAPATTWLKDSAGNGLSGGVVTYAGSSWASFGITDETGKVSKELLPGSYTFRITYGGASKDQTQDIGMDPNVIFQTRAVKVSLKDSTGIGIAGALATYAGSSWSNFGTTDAAGETMKELLPVSYTFRITYAGLSKDQSQNIANNSQVSFQTQSVLVSLKDSQGQGIAGGVVTYAGSSWLSFGTTDVSGEVRKELLPGSYKFRLTYAGASKDQTQDISLNPTVAYQTQSILVTLKTNQSYGIYGGVVTYAGSSWLSFGVTDNNGEVRKELLPGAYTFRLTYGGIAQSKPQDILVNGVVEFQW